MDDREWTKRVMAKVNPSLRQHLKVNAAFLRTLEGEDVLTEEEREEIEVIQVQSKQVDKLVDILKRTYASFSSFLDILHQCDGDLYRECKQAIEELEPERKSNPQVLAQGDRKSFPEILKPFQDELKEYYQDEMGQLPLLPWLEDGEMKNIDDIFVDLELETKKGKGGQKLGNYEDLVTIKHPTKKDSCATRVLVRGEAGSGKTSLMSKLAYSWSQNNSALTQFELVLYLKMRYLHSGSNAKRYLRKGDSEEEPDTDCSFFGEVFQQIPITNVDSNALKNYMRDNPDKILILLDGWDESVLDRVDLEEAKLNTPAHDIENILINKKQRYSCVIVTSRPYKSVGDIQSKYTIVNLKGFSDPKVEEYIRKFFQDEDKSEELNLAQKLINHLKTSENLLSLAKTPVMLMLICWMWSDPERHSLPDQQTELYYQFVSAIWARYCKKSKVNIVDAELEDKMKNALTELGKLAFEGILPVEEKLVFDKSQMQNSLADFGLLLGLLIEEKDSSKHNLLKSVKLISFLHKSFQEYCAAFYLINNSDQLKMFLESLDSWNAVLRKQEVLLFCCGLSGKIPGTCGAVEIIKHAIALCGTDGTENNDSEINVGIVTETALASFLDPRR